VLRPRHFFALLLDNIGVLAFPIAFAATASVEMIILGIVLLLKMQRGMSAGVMVVPSTSSGEVLDSKA
jgi:hypothetical protein